MYRVSQEVSDLGWADFDFWCSTHPAKLLCPSLLSLISPSRIRQSMYGATKIKLVVDLLGHPVLFFPSMSKFGSKAKIETFAFANFV